MSVFGIGPKQKFGIFGIGWEPLDDHISIKVHICMVYKLYIWIRTNIVQSITATLPVTNDPGTFQFCDIHTFTGKYEQPAYNNHY